MLENKIYIYINRRKNATVRVNRERRAACAKKRRQTKPRSLNLAFSIQCNNMNDYPLKISQKAASGFITREWSRLMNFKTVWSIIVLIQSAHTDWGVWSSYPRKFPPLLPELAITIYKLRYVPPKRYGFKPFWPENGLKQSVRSFVTFNPWLICSLIWYVSLMWFLQAKAGSLLLNRGRRYEWQSSTVNDFRQFVLSRTTNHLRKGELAVETDIKNCSYRNWVL